MHTCATCLDLLELLKLVTEKLGNTRQAMAVEMGSPAGQRRFNQLRDTLFDLNCELSLHLALAHGVERKVPQRAVIRPVDAAETSD